MVWRIWYDQRKREAMNLLENAILSWGRDNKIKTLRIEVKRGLKALQRTWGFRPVSVIMERRV
jgi:hypothetical protein